MSFKSNAVTVLTLVGLGVGAATPVWANSTAIDVTYQTKGGAGMVSGKANSVYHTLSGGVKPVLRVTAHSGGLPGSSNADLYLDQFGADKFFGDVVPTVGTHYFQKTDKSSTKYYLEFYGGKAETTQEITGSLKDK